MTDRAKPLYDCTYWWQGGSIVGAWFETDAGKVDQLKQMGYVAVNGNSRIGPPDDAPTEQEFAEVLRWKGKQING